MRALPTMKQLQYLVALAEHGQFGKAAAACNVTQSTLSAGIKELEAVLGARVAERNTRSFVLSPAAEEIVAKARTILADAESMVELARRRRRPLTGALRLGAIPTVGPFLFPSALPRIYAKYPELQLFIREDQSATLLERLSAGQLDVLLMALPYEAAGVDVEPLFEDAFVFACPAGHRLSGRATVSLDEIADEPLLLLEEGHCLRDHALDACRLEGRAKVRGFEATSLLTLAQMVAGGMGVTLLPEIATAAGLTKGLDLSLSRIAPERATRQIGLMWRKTSPRAEEFRMLGRMLTPAGDAQPSATTT